MKGDINLNLEKLCSWFVDLEANRKELILEYLNGIYKEDFNLTEEESNLFKVKSKILSLKNKNLTKKEIKEKLESYGINKFHVISFFAHMNKPLADKGHRLINLVDNSLLEKAIYHVINESLLYGSFEFYNPESFDEFYQFHNYYRGDRILGVLRYEAIGVANRMASPNMLKQDLLYRDIHPEKAEMIVKEVRKNHKELQMEGVFNKLRNIDNNIKSIKKKLS